MALIVQKYGGSSFSDEDEITTLGRGGSDLTAVALAVVNKAAACEIYTDVDGVYTADPAIVPDAKKLARVSYDEMLEMASLGAKVLQSRSVEFAKKYGVTVHVRSTFKPDPGTLATKEEQGMEEVGVAANMLATLSKEGMNIQMISTSGIAVSCVIEGKWAGLGGRALPGAFEVGKGANR